MDLQSQVLGFKMLMPELLTWVTDLTWISIKSHFFFWLATSLDIDLEKN